MALADLNRSNDTPITTLKLSDIAVKNWHRFPTPISKAMTDDIYVPVFTWNGGNIGDETVAETNVVVDDRAVGDYGPRNLTEKMAWPGAPNSVVPSEDILDGQALTSIVDYTTNNDLGAPRGFIGPSDPYSKPAPAAPVISSLTPNTGVSGAGKPPIWTTIAGTGFTQWSTVETGGVMTPYFKFISATRIDMAQDPRSTAGTVTVRVLDHSAFSNSVNFTFT